MSNNNHLQFSPRSQAQPQHQQQMQQRQHQQAGHHHTQQFNTPTHLQQNQIRQPPRIPPALATTTTMSSISASPSAASNSVMSSASNPAYLGNPLQTSSQSYGSGSFPTNATSGVDNAATFLRQQQLQQQHL